MPSLAAAGSPVALLLARDEPLARGRLRGSRSHVRVHPGVYAPVDAWRTLKPHGRYLARVHAVALARPGSVLALESAAALQGLPVFGEPRHVHIYDPDSTKSRTYGSVVVHTSVDQRTVTRIGGFLTTDPAETALDLCRVLPPAFALAIADAALRSEHGSRLSIEGLRMLAADRATRRGTRQLNWLWPRATATAESVGESVSRAVIEWLGFPDPVLQQKFSYESHDDRADFFWPDVRVIGESDGYDKYHGGSTAESMHRMIAEKRREDRLRRYTRGFARWDWKDALRAEPLAQKLIAAGLAPIRAADPGLLATLLRNPRSLPARRNPSL